MAEAIQHQPLRVGYLCALDQNARQCLRDLHRNTRDRTTPKYVKLNEEKRQEICVLCPTGLPQSKKRGAPNGAPLLLPGTEQDSRCY